MLESKGSGGNKAVCRSWQQRGSCKYGSKCRFSHEVSQRQPILARSHTQLLFWLQALKPVTVHFFLWFCSLVGLLHFLFRHTCFTIWCGVFSFWWCNAFFTLCCPRRISFWWYVVICKFHSLTCCWRPFCRLEQMVNFLFSITPIAHLTGIGCH